jgi:hypothetical protein
LKAFTEENKSIFTVKRENNRESGKSMGKRCRAISKGRGEGKAGK